MLVLASVYLEVRLSLAGPGANSWMDAEMEFPRMDLGKRREGDGESVIQMQAMGSEVHREGSKLLREFSDCE